MNLALHVWYTIQREQKYLTCIAYEYTKIWIKVLSSHAFSVFNISYVWFQNKIVYYILREISHKLTINKYIYSQ